jgi:hypothetical protein
VSRGTRVSDGPLEVHVRDSHPLWSAFPGRSIPSTDRYSDPTTPDCKQTGLGCSPFARRYLGNRSYFLLVRLLRCFSSPTAPLQPMDSAAGDGDVLPDGFPHSDTCGSKPDCSSPQRFAAYRVLHRHCAPRHPPRALRSLTPKETTIRGGGTATEQIKESETPRNAPRSLPPYKTTAPPGERSPYSLARCKRQTIEIVFCVRCDTHYSHNANRPHGASPE